MQSHGIGGGPRFLEEALRMCAEERPDMTAEDALCRTAAVAWGSSAAAGAVRDPAELRAHGIVSVADLVLALNSGYAPARSALLEAFERTASSAAAAVPGCASSTSLPAGTTAGEAVAISPQRRRVADASMLSNEGPPSVRPRVSLGALGS
mmetsp:Transcript_95258/g.179114  ORF Transcript_95258/g.179114 Transcript_95258/m.179114 type:complete len:151 (+) Transcript_95258:49-501(+)